MIPVDEYERVAKKGGLPETSLQLLEMLPDDSDDEQPKAEETPGASSSSQDHSGNSNLFQM